ncbi:MAG: glutamine-hydrolyzing GMP synthase [Myxococcota bacterium]
MAQDKILIIDFGSQVTQLIARRVRELNVYSEIFPPDVSDARIREFDPAGIILSGGPDSVLQKGAPFPKANLFSLGLPVLGICYGQQLMMHLIGGKVEKAKEREYGRALLKIVHGGELFAGFQPGDEIPVWMSHGDRVIKMPRGFRVVGRSKNSPYAAVADSARKLYGVQFHPEVYHTPRGREILKNFALGICGAKPTWTMESFIDRTINDVRDRVGEKGRVVLGLSGGVDSSVVAVLLHRALGERLTSIFVNNGLLRKGEAESVKEFFGKKIKLNLKYIDASERFLSALKRVTDPEKKRKIIGRIFINVFNEEAKKIKGVEYLAQGTLYPDVIESVSTKGPSATIKSHHNVGGLPKRMPLKLIEPLRELFKDEVRAVGRELGMPEEIIVRHPFPGPGLAVRVIGEVTEERLKVLRDADAIVMEEVKRSGLYEAIWQSFAVLLPIKTVGVMGDERTYENVIALRAVESSDGMTADWVKLPYELMGTISRRIINEVRGANRVVYDISSKPPSTIEWE